MTASPFLRYRNEILVTALAVIVLALIVAAMLGAAERVSASWGPACHRLLPQLPSLPRPMPWRIAACAGRGPVP